MFPHGDLDERIAEISLQIEAFPDSMQLLLTRGELYIQHEEYEKAKQDFSQCLRHHFDSSFVMMGMSTCFLFEGNADSSLFYVDKVLRCEPSNLSALELKAKGLISAGRYCQAGKILVDILTQAEHAAPLLYIQASSAYSQCDNIEGPDSSIYILEWGLVKLQGNRVLQNQLIIHYKNALMFDKALALQSSAIEKNDFKVRSLLDRAITYIEMGQFEFAKKDLHQALIEWESLSPRKKDLDAMKELKTTINAHLSTLEE